MNHSKAETYAIKNGLLKINISMEHRHDRLRIVNTGLYKKHY